METVNNTVLAPPPTPPKPRRKTALFALLIIGIVVLALAQSRTDQPPTSQQQAPTGATAPNTKSPSPITFESGGDRPFTVENIYSDAVPFKRDDQVFVAEMDLLRYVMEDAKAKGWSGKETDKLPIKASEFPREKIDAYAKDNAQTEEYFTIPTNLRPLFIGTTAKIELEQLITTSYNEYLAYLEWKNVDSRYITEIKQNALPNTKDRIFYHDVDGSENPPTAVQGLKNSEGYKDDFSKLQLDMYGSDVYNHTRSIMQSGILGPIPQDTSSKEYYEYFRHARELGLRYLMYHEMSHVLQRAVDTQNNKPEDRKHKAAWGNATKSMWLISDKYFIVWDDIETLSDVENHNLSQESQAEGISFEMLTTVYNMSSVQKRLAWEYLFGRLDTARDDYDAAMTIFQNNYKGYSIVGFDNKVYKDFITQFPTGSYEAMTLYQVNKLMGNLSSYGGYFHPVLPEDMPKLWEYIRN